MWEHQVIQHILLT
jgi:hypothetical protein